MDGDAGDASDEGACFMLFGWYERDGVWKGCQKQRGGEMVGVLSRMDGEGW